jgi:plastocyanin
MGLPLRAPGRHATPVPPPPAAPSAADGRRRALRLLLTALAFVAAALSACGEAGGVAPPPSESLQAGIYGGGTIPPSTAATATATPSTTASASPASVGTAAPGGPCNGCGTKVTGATPAATVEANDQDRFAPETVTVNVGQVVEWKDVGVQSHTVTFSSDPSISDNLMKTGQTWEIRFTKAGSFSYVCLFHEALGMIGTVIVSAG